MNQIVQRVHVDPFARRCASVLVAHREAVVDVLGAGLGHARVR